MADDKSKTDWGAIAGNAATAIGQTAVAVAETKKQFKRQKEAMALQAQMNREAWDLQNAYNTPQAQMERLQLAGLNPRLIYGSGSGGGPVAGPMSVPDVPVQGTAHHEVSDQLFKYMQYRQMDQQYKATNMNMDLMRKNAALKELEAGLKTLDLFRETLRKDNMPELVKAEVDLKKWTALRAGELYSNEKTKGGLMDQLHDMRKKQMTGIELDNAFKQHRNELAKLGIYTHDHPAFRVLIQAANRMGIDLGELLAEGANKLKYLLDLGR